MSLRTDRLRERLGDLQCLTEYRTEPYCQASEKQEGAPLQIILARGDMAAGVYNAANVYEGELLGLAMAAPMPS